MTYKIRRAIEDDAASFENFMATIFAEGLDTLVPRGFTPTVAQVKDYVAQHASGDSALFLAETEGAIVGSVSLTRLSRPQLNHTVGLGLNVAEPFRNQGIGRALLRRAMQWGKESTVIERIELEVMANNLAALRLYAQSGFHLEGTKSQAVKKPYGYLDIHIYGFITSPAFIPDAPL